VVYVRLATPTAYASRFRRAQAPGLHGVVTPYRAASCAYANRVVDSQLLSQHMQHFGVASWCDNSCGCM
jgi:hypothetical protein